MARSNNKKQYWLDRLLTMTKIVRRRDLSLYLGKKPSPEDQTVALNIEEVREIKSLFGILGKEGKVYNEAVDHFLRTKIEPFQAMFDSWMRGAAAQVNGENVPFTEIITWCQDCEDNRARKTLGKETLSLCRFLAPFSHASWKGLLQVVENDLGYEGYIPCCEEKKRVSLGDARKQALLFLDETKAKHESCIRPLLREMTGLSLEDASRFDAIYLLGLRYLDHLFPPGLTVKRVIDFFNTWGMQLSDHPGLHLHIQGKPGRQSYCIPVSIPSEIHVVTGPLHGWLDLEALYHELGHAMSFLFADPHLPVEDREFLHSGALSETYAFLLQKMCLSRVFLQDVLGLSEKDARKVEDVHEVKWLALTRRYAAKLVIEVDNFREGRLQKGEKHYAQIMQRETGFHYDPETYLFDLMPDFYSYDYFQAFMGTGSLWKYLAVSKGCNWPVNPATGDILKNWWKMGNHLDPAAFLDDVSAEYQNESKAGR
ncbi:MAG: hypothetical protein U9R66_09005 [Thermodesulfobacteriota bacterium]|nr:hypothetical protein [Thermodesulfobacteriota bacterium]